MSSYWIIDGKRISNEEYMEIIRRQEAAREQARQQAAALMKRLSDSYTELAQFMEQNPGIVQRVDSDPEQMQQTIYQKLRQNLQAANQAPRCQWIKDDGIVCGSPRMRKSDYCFAHMQMWETKPKKMRGWPAVGDGNAIQLAIMEVQRALIDDEISEKRAGLLLYSLQIASGNLDRTTFGEKPEEMVTDCVDMEEDREIRPQPAQNRRGPGAPEIGPSDHQESGENKDYPGLAMNAKEPDLGKKLPQSEHERAWGELPMAAMATDTLSGAPSTALGTSPAD
jgi:hypothetical protein